MDEGYMLKIRKTIIIVLPAVILLIALCIYMAGNKDKLVDVSTVSLGNSEKITLGSYMLEEYSLTANNIFVFLPKDIDGFLDTVLKFENYIGLYKYPEVGSPDQESYMFYYDGIIYALIMYNPGFGLVACSSLFQSTLGDCSTYYYISPGRWSPEGTESAVYNEDFGSFEDFFGDFETAVTNFYGYISEEYVSINPANKTITLVTFNRDNLEVNKEHLVIIDFVNKTVTESYKKGNEE